MPLEGTHVRPSSHVLHGGLDLSGEGTYTFGGMFRLLSTKLRCAMSTKVHMPDYKRLCGVGDAVCRIKV